MQNNAHVLLYYDEWANHRVNTLNTEGISCFKMKVNNDYIFPEAKNLQYKV